MKVREAILEKASLSHLFDDLKSSATYAHLPHGSQFKEYLNRAEYLKGAVAGQDSDAHGPEGGAAAQKVKKPGAAGKEDVSPPILEARRCPDHLLHNTYRMIRRRRG